MDDKLVHVNSSRILLAILRGKPAGGKIQVEASLLRYDIDRIRGREQSIPLSHHGQRTFYLVEYRENGFGMGLAAVQAL